VDNEAAMGPVMQEGTRAMLDHGFTDLAGDLLPFISMLMEEQRYYHFDHSRIAIFGEGLKGVVPFTQMMTTLRSMDPAVDAGVCRDTQESGLRMLRYLLGYYYDTYYHEAEINPDDFLFLQSWVTNSGQHVTTSFIDPFDRQKQYELDWGKVVVKTRQQGYDNGRQYGSVYRIWKFSPARGITVPVDSRRSQLGRMLDEQLYSVSEMHSFTGLYTPDIISDVKAQWFAGKRGGMTVSAGRLAQGQSYLAGTYTLAGKGSSVRKWIRYSGRLAVQSMLMEDRLRRNTYMPRENDDMIGSFLLQTRYLASLETFPLFSKNQWHAEAFLNGMVEALWLANRIWGEGEHHLQKAGDAGLYVTQGIRLTRDPGQSGASFYVKLQNRSFLAAKEVRYMAPNPFVLIPEAKWVSPGVDLVTGVKVPAGHRVQIDAELTLERTNLDCVFAGFNTTVSWKPGEQVEFQAEAGFNYQLSGPFYYWYPVNRGWISPGIRVRKWNTIFGANLQALDGGEHSTGFSIRYGL
jgi:hypothetical protein